MDIIIYLFIDPLFLVHLFKFRSKLNCTMFIIGKIEIEPSEIYFYYLLIIRFLILIIKFLIK